MGSVACVVLVTLFLIVLMSVDCCLLFELFHLIVLCIVCFCRFSLMLFYWVGVLNMIVRLHRVLVGFAALFGLFVGIYFWFLIVVCLIWLTV